MQRRNHGWKVEGDQGLGPNTGALAPRTRSKAGLGIGCGRGRPSHCEGPGITPENFWKLDAKSCILVTTCCEISCFLKTTDKKLQGHCWPPNLKVGDQSPPVPTVVAPMENVLKLAWPWGWFVSTLAWQNFFTAATMLPDCSLLL